jgi:hypothetical protein
MSAPSYSDIDLTNTNLLCGFYSIGLIEQYYSNIKVIDACQWRKNGSGDRHEGNGYNWLNNEIKAHLLDEKIVLVIPEDEEVMYPLEEQFVSILNKYTNDKVYFVTQMPDSTIYTDGGINCKILELPWMMTNDCLCYHAIKTSTSLTNTTKYNYITFTGRVQQHKISLLQKLHDLDLSKYGLLTVMNNNEHQYNLPDALKADVVINADPPYTEYQEYQLDKQKHHELYSDDYRGFMEGGFHKINDIWVSANVVNFVKIQEMYHDVPLVVHAETTTGIFPMTEKSVWPVLLGKLFLIHGHKGVMNEIKRFYDIDMSEYINLAFDDLDDGWSDEADIARITMMLSDNKSLIQNASQVYNDYKPLLEKASYTFGENMYNFFISQLDKIITKEIT